jgi:hypothetical protein
MMQHLIKQNKTGLKHSNERLIKRKKRRCYSRDPHLKKIPAVVLK